MTPQAARPTSPAPNSRGRNNEPRRLAAQASDFIKANASESFSRGIRLQNAWEKVASEAALEHTDNVVFSTRSKEESVIVYVQDSHWAAELSMQRELYRILLEEEYGHPIADLKFLVTRKASLKKLFQKKKRDKKPQTKPVPLSPQEDGYAREIVSAIKDEQLKSRLYKAMKADFEWKKGSEGLNLPQEPSERAEPTEF